MKPLALDGPATELLQRFGFDRTQFAAHQKLLRDGADPFHRNRITQPVAPPPTEAIVPFPSHGSAKHAEFVIRGQAAIAQGQVGSVVLAGGMATRFGGVVKATVEALDGKSFLALKLQDAQSCGQAARGVVPVFLMTSFATDEDIKRYLTSASLSDSQVEVFSQFVSLRLERDGSIFRTPAGSPSLYAPGHGDLPEALNRSGILQRFLASGGTTLLISNVDNLAATLDPAVIGAHLAAGKPVTVEVTDKVPGDRGGAPATVDGHVQIVESFRFPQSFDQDRISVFNTNTIVCDAGILETPPELTWFAVEKAVEGRTAIQFERLIGQLTAFFDTQYLKVPRSGLESRFEPAKDPEELAARRPTLRALLQARAGAQ